MSKTHTISILGCGWYGFALAKELVKLGYSVKGSTTSEEKLAQLSSAGIEAFLVKFSADYELYDADFFRCDVLVISIPPHRKSGEAGLYPEKIRRIKKAAELEQVRRVLFISSTGVYPETNAEVDEDVLPEPKTESGKAILAAENLLKNSDHSAVTILRFGGLIGPGRNPGKFFAGKKNVPNGNAPVNLIHLNDCIGITKAIIEREMFGYTFNACSSEHPLKKEFYIQAAKTNGLEPPEFIEELNNWKIVNSKHIKELLGYSISKI